MTDFVCLECKRTLRRNAGNHLRCYECSSVAQRGMVRASNKVRRAVRRGDLPNLKAEVVACADCGANADRYDHRDYLKPLDVAPVCHACNRLRGPGLHAMEAGQ